MQDTVLFTELRWPELKDLAEQEAIVLLPMGQVEEHGTHSPVGTDVFISEETARRVAEEARKRSMYICFGFSSLQDGKVYNAAGLWDREGQLVGIYHKTHIQTHDLQYSPGMDLPVWPSPWGPLGIMICADRRWPETARTLRLKGAKLILNPTYGMHHLKNEWWMRTRSYENQCFIAFTHPSVGFVVNPHGDVAERRREKPGVLLCEIDLAEAKDDNHIRDRRPELYEIIAAPKEDQAAPK